MCICVPYDVYNSTDRDVGWELEELELELAANSVPNQSILADVVIDEVLPHTWLLITVHLE